MSTRSRISLTTVTPANLGTVRKLNSVLFPIRYSEKFYKDIVSPDAEAFCKLIYFNDIPVGTICCRLERSTPEGPKKESSEAKLYLMTMGVLAPYRSRKLGTRALHEILSAAAIHSKPKVTHVHLHVQEGNDEARKFYERHGFALIGKDETYYKQIEPHSAWILERAVSPEDKDLATP